ncbi:MAG: hypothetical protein IIC92_04340 [Chloroflexi bacterium]|nr:hypothetical protein [Chloroflexota bacterium]
MGLVRNRKRGGDATLERFADIKLTTHQGSIPTPSETLDPLAEGCDVVVRLLKRLRAVCVAGFLPPGMGVVTVDKIAVSAAMAGCEPSHLPVLIAACEAVLKMGTRARRWLMSTSPGAPIMLLDGPAMTRGIDGEGACRGWRGLSSR